MKTTKDLRRTVIAGLIAGVVASCGPTGVDMMGDAMVDAGEMMMDAGRIMMDGGDALDAAADSMTPDAEAQACGMNCSAAGTQRVLTADTDPAQMESGTATGMGSVEVVSGPFVLTDAHNLSSGRYPLLFVADAATGCAAVTTPEESGVALIGTAQLRRRHDRALR